MKGRVGLPPRKGERMSATSTTIATEQPTVLETVALEIGRDMAAAEVAIDQAITRVAKLMAKVPEARMRADLSAVVGQHVFDHMGSTISSLTTGRGELVKVHRLLETLRRELHLPEVSYGDKGYGPQISTETAASAGLRIVAG